MKYIFLHGLGQNSDAWEMTVNSMNIEAFAECPNLFSLVSDKEINYYNLYESFCNYLNTFSEPVNLCGLSLGGILALNYLIENPYRVNSAALIGTQYSMPKKLLKFQNVLFRIMPNKMFVKTGLKKSDIIKLSESMSDLNFEKNLKKINCPVLVVCGKNDKANMDAALQLNALIPNSKLNIMPNAGHEINIEAPMKLGAILNEFFEL